MTSLQNTFLLQTGAWQLEKMSSDFKHGLFSIRGHWVTIDEEGNMIILMAFLSQQASYETSEFWVMIQSVCRR